MSCKTVNVEAPQNPALREKKKKGKNVTGRVRRNFNSFGVCKRHTVHLYAKICDAPRRLINQMCKPSYA